MLFLDPPSINKLELFKYLLSHPSVTFREVLDGFPFSKQTLNRYLKDLQGELLIFKDKPLTLTTNKGKIILRAVSANLVPYYIDSLHLFYVKNSTEFILIRVLMKQKYTSGAELIEILPASKSTVYRQLERVEKILRSFNISLNFTEADEYINFIFEEKNMRAFHYYFYWYTYKGLEWPFFKTTEDEYQQLTQNIVIPSSISEVPSKRKQYDYIVLFTFWRSLRRKETIRMEPNIQSILAVFLSVNDLSGLFDSFENNLSAEELWQERLFLNYILRANLTELDSTNNIHLITEKLLQLNDPIINHSRAILSELIAFFQLQLTKENYDSFFYCYVLFYIHVFYLRIDLPSVLTTYDTTNIWHETDRSLSPFNDSDVESFLNDFRNRYPIPKSYHFFEFFLTGRVINSRKKKALTICIHFSTNPVGETLIKERLCTIFNPDIIKFTDEPTQADLIISDCYEFELFKADFFYLYRVADINDWKKLVNYIKELLFALTFSL